MSVRKRINQTDLPRVSIAKALRLPRALVEQRGSQPTPPLDLAIAVGVKPSSSGWRELTGSAIGYGLTEGGYNSASIGLTELGRRAVAPREEGEDIEALREACLKPTVIGRFLQKYEGNKFPREDIARNVLIGEFSVPAERVDDALTMIVECAETIGAFRRISDDRYVSLAPIAALPGVRDDPAEEGVAEPASSPETGPEPVGAIGATRETREEGVRTVFVGHSGGTKVLQQVKQLLELGDLASEIAVEQETAAIPVPDKVFDAMRRSDAAIICVTADSGYEAKGGYQVNANVLIEIGAAYVCHEKRLVLLWDRRVAVPSNLQGLYRCEFEGDELSWEAGTKLQRALIAIKRGRIPA